MFVCSQRHVRSVLALVLFACAAVALNAAPLHTRLTHYGFTAASGLAPRGAHISSGWSLGFPIGGLAVDAQQRNALYAGFWHLTFFATPPLPPTVTIPLALLPGATGSYESVEYPLQIVGLKPPTVPYPYHAYTIAATNGVRCAADFVSQTPDNSQWSLLLSLDDGDELELALVCSNVFGESSQPTVLHITQVPEPVAAFMASAGAILILRVIGRQHGRRYDC